MYKETFGEKLKTARKRTGFTQIEVMKELHIPQSTLAKYENGKREPDIETLGLLADFYGVSIDWLIGTGMSKGEYKKEQDKSKHQSSATKIG